MFLLCAYFLQFFKLQEVFDEGVSLPNGTIVQVWKNTEAYEIRDVSNFDSRAARVLWLLIDIILLKQTFGILLDILL